MSGWTFQLQQEGDESWLPLESPDVEIGEGRYRLIGQGPSTSAVKLRISYLPLGEPEQDRRVHHCSIVSEPDFGYTLLPLKYLQPGEWEVMIEGGPTLKLQVREQSGLTETLWGLPHGLTSVFSEPGSVEPLPPDEDPPQSRHYTLLLRQDQFQAHPGDMLTLAGEIRSPEAPITARTGQFLILSLVLSTANGRIVLEQSTPQEANQWPLTFQLPLRLPSDLPKGLLNGKLCLAQNPATDAPLAEAFLRLEIHCPAAAMDAMQWMNVPETPKVTPEEAPRPETPTGQSPLPQFEAQTPEPPHLISSEAEPEPGDRLFGHLREIVLAAHAAATEVSQPQPMNDVATALTPKSAHHLPQRSPQSTAGVRPLDPVPNLTRQEERVQSAPAADPTPPAPTPPELTSIPEPHLTLPLEDCEPGTRVPLEFRLPRTARRLAVKWWLQDARNQKRWGGSRLVLNFVPCSEQELLALIEVPLPPLGCTWTLQAVTFDLLSQQESRSVQLALGIPRTGDQQPE